MENWKRAVIAGSVGASAILLIKGRKPAGILFAGLGLAALASEYPEHFQKLRDDLPEYMDRGTRFLEVVAKVGERLAEATERSGRSAWKEILSR